MSLLYIIRQMRQDMRDNLCKASCPYFKPSKEGTLECGGMLVVERLLKNGKVIDFVGTDRAYDYELQEMLIQTICTVCPFSPHDCDFSELVRLSTFKRQEITKPLPCGGFIILTDLVGRQIITIDDIRDII